MRTLTIVAASAFLLAIVGSANIAQPADPTPAAPVKAPTTRPTSIFDFGLEPLPNAEEDKSDKTDARKPVDAPPTPAKPATPQPDPAPVAKPTPPAPVSTPPARESPKSPGADLADVLKACHIDANGVLTSDDVVTLGLKGTEGRHFILTGDMYLAPEPTKYSSGNVTFRLRRVTMKKSIDLNINLMRVKRILLEGEVLKKFAVPMNFPPLDREKWLPFKIDAGGKAITVHFGQYQGIAKGPVATEGTNSITLSPGAKLRNLKLQILND